MSGAFDFEQLVGLCRRAHHETQRSSVHAVDRYLVTRNWLFGWYIVEYEQSGADRAKYGAAVVKSLTDNLTVRGCSSRSLALSRRFYRRYAGILQTPSAKSPSMPADQQFHARRPTSGSPVASDELPHTPADDSPTPRPSVSDRFRQAGIKGASATRLKLYRQRKPIGPTPPAQLLLAAFDVVETREIRPKPSDATSSHIGTAAPSVQRCVSIAGQTARYPARTSRITRR